MGDNMPAEEFDRDDTSAAVEKTIETMQNLQLCVDPVHKHSFAPVSFLISGPMRVCSGCGERLNSVLGIGQAPQVVRCVACKAYAHRSCAFSTDKSKWAKTCPVNTAVVGMDDDVTTDDSREDLLEQSGVLLAPQNEPIISQKLEESIVHVQEEAQEELVEPEDLANSSSVSNTFGDSFEDMKTPSPTSSLVASLSDDQSTSDGSELYEHEDDYVIESTPPVEAPVLISEEDHAEISQNEIDENIVHVQQAALIVPEENQTIDQNASDENIVHVQQEETIAMADTEASETVHDMSPFTQVRKIPSSALLVPFPSDDTEEAPLTPSSSSSSHIEKDEIIMVWTPEGPPRHWACEESLEGIQSAASHSVNDRASVEEESEEDADADEKEEPLNYEKHPFASVSRVLQDSVLAYFRPSPKKDPGETIDDTAEEVGAESQLEEEVNDSTEDGTTTGTDVDVKSLLTEVQPAPKQEEKPLMRLASGTLDVAKTSVQARRKLGLVSVAGGIAGGAAGLLVAGPAGAVIGAKLFQTAGVLGVIIESSVGVGVVVAGVAAASFTAQQLQEKEAKRVLTLGQGDSRKVVLVRPNVIVDPIWDDICADAIKTAPSMKRMSFGVIPTSSGRKADMAKRERNRRDTDIVETDEYEIPTEDKVILLVNRSLNDKYSLPGHVYRCLIKKHRERSNRDRVSVEENAGLVHSSLASEKTADEEINVKDGERQRRQDAHAVIKHVTATLLEVRPGFASSPKITEMSATAVEGLVFGELYDSVFEEINEETNAADEKLLERISSFEADQASTANSCSHLQWREGISEAAIEALQSISQAHSAVGKLQICVHFVELVSTKFSTPRQSQEQRGQVINADSLLKMVCQHIIAAKVPNINAEIGFLEEFARDEHLLRGKEGYALVTLQASLHFLNASADFEKDIFSQEDGENRT